MFGFGQFVRAGGKNGVKAHETDDRRGPRKNDRAVGVLWVSPCPNPGVGTRRRPVQGTGKDPGTLTAGLLNRVRSKSVQIRPPPIPANEVGLSYVEKVMVRMMVVMVTSVISEPGPACSIPGKGQ